MNRDLDTMDSKISIRHARQSLHDGRLEADGRSVVLNEQSFEAKAQDAFANSLEQRARTRWQINGNGPTISSPSGLPLPQSASEVGRREGWSSDYLRHEAEEAGRRSEYLRHETEEEGEAK